MDYSLIKGKLLGNCSQGFAFHAGLSQVVQHTQRAVNTVENITHFANSLSLIYLTLRFKL
ncbi:hypothetical protein CSING_05000 [Corynebacterium singulare]|uniref:Uncharacterized protein n=1 Tax=Corynebacterium singulare TaxID=161899 RepID=A0A0B6F025_9CORY|nr:hypothetical protein CSING_05000 [Corynebacterium singulare]